MIPEPDEARGATGPDAWRMLSAGDRLARVVDASPAALVLAGSSGSIEMVNRQAERMFGYDRDELTNMPLENLIPERFRSGHAALRVHFQAGGMPRMMGQGRDLFGLRKDGTEFPLEIGLNPIDLDGQAMVLAGIIDITVRQRIEAGKEKQRAELARSNADLEEFAYVASHDLKAPLRAISHLVEWIAEDVEAAASSETIDNLTLLRGRVVRLQALLDGLLAYSRVGHAAIEPEDVDVAAVIEDIVAVLAPPAGFAVICEGTMPLLRTHRASLLVVLQNLIGNAIKHNDGPDGSVTITMRKQDGVAEFRVRDAGPGIAPRFHERIFVIFQTLESRDDVEASGIGLAIVKRRIESHGGRIRVESEPPARGTTFVFTWREQAA